MLVGIASSCIMNLYMRHATRPNIALWSVLVFIGLFCIGLSFFALVKTQSRRISPAAPEPISQNQPSADTTPISTPDEIWPVGYVVQEGRVARNFLVEGVGVSEPVSTDLETLGFTSVCIGAHNSSPVTRLLTAKPEPLDAGTVLLWESCAGGGGAWAYWLYSLEQNTLKRVTLPQRGVGDVSPSGRFIALIDSQNGGRTLFLQDLLNNKETVLATLPPGETFFAGWSDFAAEHYGPIVAFWDEARGRVNLQVYSSDILENQSMSNPIKRFLELAFQETP